MGNKEKLLKRLETLPRDFTFDETKTLMKSCGYRMSTGGKTGGSRVKFYLGKNVFAMHKPHPRKELLAYQVNELLSELKEKGFYE